MGIFKRKPVATTPPVLTTCVPCQQGKCSHRRNVLCSAAWCRCTAGKP